MKNNLFKHQASDELYSSMEKQLVSNQVESTYGFTRLAQAADYLNQAAQIFDQAGMFEQSKEITEVLEDFASHLS